MKDVIEKIIGALQDKGRLSTKQAIAGFDGFIDSVARAVKHRNSETECELFPTIECFGSHIVSKKGMSCSIEIKPDITKFGGNMPILSNAMGSLGVKVTCVGALGFPEIHPEFKKMSANCHLRSVANPDSSTALEFDDGKIMLYQTDTSSTLDWITLKTVLGAEELLRFFQGSDLVCLVNWSEMIHSSAVWEGILSEILPLYEPLKAQTALFDLADCSNRGKEEILAALRIIGRFSDRFETVLSMNENEARLVFRALADTDEVWDIEAVGSEIYKEMNIHTVIVHTVRHAFAWDASGAVRVEGPYVEHPALSTGGGDNFNAGFCAGRLLDLDMTSCLTLGVAVSGFYVKFGHSPAVDEIIDFFFSASF